MTRHYTHMIGLLFAGALTACADAPPKGLDRTGRGAPAPLAYAPPGTEIVLANTAGGEASTTRLTVGVGQNLRGGFQREDGSEGSFFPACWACGNENWIEESLYAALWPLETGKRVAFLRFTPDGGKARVVIDVVGTETIDTQAGRFDTYRLAGRITGLGSPPWSAKVDAWWAPDPGWVVKASGIDGQGQALTSEAVSITPP